jgi:hypothetical protein
MCFCPWVGVNLNEDGRMMQIELLFPLGLPLASMIAICGIGIAITIAVAGDEWRKLSSGELLLSSAFAGMAACSLVLMLAGLSGVYHYWMTQALRTVGLAVVLGFCTHYRQDLSQVRVAKTETIAWLPIAFVIVVTAVMIEMPGSIIWPLNGK